MERVNIIVSYDPKAGYVAAKNEIQDILTKLGDQNADKELLVPGIIAVKTKIKNRKVIEEVREIFVSDPLRLNSAIKWVPTDHWCKPAVEEIIRVVKEEIVPLITQRDRYSIDVEKHKSELDKKELIDKIAAMIKGKVDLEYPDKIIRIDLFQDRAGITLLGKHDVFSLAKGE